MPIVQNTEDAGIELAGAVVLLILLGVGLVSYLAVKNISPSPGLYPDSLWSKFASFIDGIFYNSPLPDSAKKTVESPVDEWLASVYGWITDNLPRAANSGEYDAYAAGLGSDTGSVEVSYEGTGAEANA
jgi:hypothetical protein